MFVRCDASTASMKSILHVNLIDNNVLPLVIQALLRTVKDPQDVNLKTVLFLSAHSGAVFLSPLYLDVPHGHIIS